MAALTMARLTMFIQKVLKISKPNVFWTDSTDVLFWITNSKPRKTFVENHVATILQLTSAKQWGHVNGVDNPADFGTRGVSISTIITSEKK